MLKCGLAKRRPDRWEASGLTRNQRAIALILLAARLGMAVGSAATEAPPHSMISDMYPPEQRASAISLFMLGVPVAAILGSFLGGAIAEHYNWRDTFLFFGVAGGLIALLCFVFLKEPARHTVTEAIARPGTWQVVKVLFGSNALVLLLAGVCCISVGSYGINGFLPAYFSRNFGLDAAGAGLAFGLLSGIASLIGTLMGGYVSERLAKRDGRWLLGFPALGSVIGAPLFAFGIMIHDLYVAFPVMLVGAFFFYTAMGPAIATLHGSLDSFGRATGSALFLLISHLLGQGLGPPLAGYVSDMIARATYHGSFAADCAGAAAQVAGSACKAASAGGLQGAIAIMALFYFAGGVLLYLATRAGWRRQTSR
jgi:predicted MFS family arabinose efflux permease